MTLLNNLVYSYGISPVFQMVFRSAQPMLTMMIGSAGFAKRYTFSQFLAALGVCIGAALATIAEGLRKSQAAACASTPGSPCSADAALAMSHGWHWAAWQAKLEQVPAMMTGLVASLQASWEAGDELGNWLLGLCLLLGVVSLSAVLGHLQAAARKKYGTDNVEAIALTHALPIPLMLLMLYDHSKEHIHMWLDSPALQDISEQADHPALGMQLMGQAGGLLSKVWPMAAHLPAMATFAAVNVVTQGICVSGVFIMLAECSPLASNLVMTLRKIFSLVLSIWLFNSKFTALHWVSAAVVFGSVLLYAVASQRAAAAAVAAAGPAPSSANKKLASKQRQPNAKPGKIKHA